METLIARIVSAVVALVVAIVDAAEKTKDEKAAARTQLLTDTRKVRAASLVHAAEVLQAELETLQDQAAEYDRAVGVAGYGALADVVTSAASQLSTSTSVDTASTVTSLITTAGDLVTAAVEDQDWFSAQDGQGIPTDTDIYNLQNAVDRATELVREAREALEKTGRVRPRGAVRQVMRTPAGGRVTLMAPAHVEKPQPRGHGRAAIMGLGVIGVGGLLWLLTRRK